VDGYSKLFKNRTISTAANTNQKASKSSLLSGAKIRRSWFSALMILKITFGPDTALSLQPHGSRFLFTS